ncbi:MAG: hypothetical protein QOD77_1222 [Thermoplasmata archaeon]|jgi:hypothetical protein|nr:hypothetical protein [Thermoplasmata archaeon]
MRLLAALATILAVGAFGHALYLTAVDCDWSADTASDAAGDARSCASQLTWQTVLALGFLLAGAVGIAFGRQMLAWGGALGAMVVVLVFGVSLLVLHGFLMMVAALVWQMGTSRPRASY